MDKIQKVQITVTYKIKDRLSETVDKRIGEIINSIGGVWYAQGRNYTTGIRDICFDLDILQTKKEKNNN